MRSMLFVTMILALAIVSTSIASDSRAEYHVEFTITERIELVGISRIISISGVQGQTVYAFGRDRELAALTELGYDYTIITQPESLTKSRLPVSTSTSQVLDEYPTYGAFMDTLEYYGASYPSICQVIHAETPTQGNHEIVFAKISGDVALVQDEPEVLYIGGIHGNEPVAYAILLRLIDTLLVGYAAGEPGIVSLIDSTVIWIAPLVNPDGMYAAGDHTIEGGTRSNFAGVDLNRNFPAPGPFCGDHPDGNDYQIETQILMDLADANTFVLAADFHNGVPASEYVNYPWDYFYPDDGNELFVRNHPDSQLFIHLAREYADSAQFYSPALPNYMTGGIDNGIGHGGAVLWTCGTHQDYMTFSQGCREVIVELVALDRSIDAASVEEYWQYNRISLLTLPRNALNGIRGIVSDSRTGDPIEAVLEIVGHDIEEDSSYVFTDPNLGDYHRMIEPSQPGQPYSVKVSAPGYPDVIQTGVTVTEGQSTRVDFSLTWVCGDLNGDGVVTSADPVLLIDYVFRGGPAPPVIQAADVNCDGAITSADIVLLINYIYRSGPPPCALCQ